jgi:hypothetical protein
MAITLTGDTESPMINATINPYTGYTYESLGGASRLTPRFQDIFVNTRPRISTAEQLLQAARERLRNAGAAARMKMREQEEQGVRSYVPADPVSASFEIARKTGESGVPLPRQAVSPTQLQQRPTGGVIASYGPNERVVTGNRGAGSAVIPTGPRKPATFDGMSKEQFFGQAAARQGVDNKYARAEKTGKVDELGRPIYTSKAIPKGNTATSERIYEAIKKGGEKEKNKKAA